MVTFYRQIDNQEEAEHKFGEILFATTTTTSTETDIEKTSKRSKRKPNVIFPFIKSNICPVCKQQYSTRKSVVAHYKLIHAKYGIKCTDCAYSFATMDHLEEHSLRTHHVDNVLLENTQDEMVRNLQKKLLL